MHGNGTPKQIRSYVIERLLAMGGMGAVYVARHEVTQLPVALKVMKILMQDAASQRARFLREVRAAARIGHPGIVRVYDAGETESGDLFIAMELLEGRSLEQIFVQETDPALRVALVAQILEPLKAAHHHGIVHRDLKPANVFVVESQLNGRSDREVKLLDFGIASDARDGRVTQTGILLGTPYYMSPEQAFTPSQVGAASDIWSFGVMLYEALAGHVPFVGETPHSVVMQSSSQPHPPLHIAVPDVLPELAAIVDSCLVKAPQERLATASEAWNRLIPLLTEQRCQASLVALAAADARPAVEAAVQQGRAGGAAVAQGAVDAQLLALAPTGYSQQTPDPGNRGSGAVASAFMRSTGADSGPRARVPSYSQALVPGMNASARTPSSGAVDDTALAAPAPVVPLQTPHSHSAPAAGAWSAGGYAGEQSARYGAGSPHTVGSAAPVPSLNPDTVAPRDVEMRRGRRRTGSVPASVGWIVGASLLAGGAWWAWDAREQPQQWGRPEVKGQQGNTGGGAGAQTHAATQQVAEPAAAAAETAQQPASGGVEADSASAPHKQAAPEAADNKARQRAAREKRRKRARGHRLQRRKPSREPQRLEPGDTLAQPGDEEGGTFGALPVPAPAAPAATAKDQVDNLREQDSSGQGSVEAGDARVGSGGVRATSAGQGPAAKLPASDADGNGGRAGSASTGPATAPTDPASKADQGSSPGGRGAASTPVEVGTEGSSSAAPGKAVPDEGQPGQGSGQADEAGSGATAPGEGGMQRDGDGPASTPEEAPLPNKRGVVPKRASSEGAAAKQVEAPAGTGPADGS